MQTRPHQSRDFSVDMSQCILQPVRRRLHWRCAGVDVSPYRAAAPSHRGTDLSTLLRSVPCTPFGPAGHCHCMAMVPDARGCKPANETRGGVYRSSSTAEHCAFDPDCVACRWDFTMSSIDAPHPRRRDSTDELGGFSKRGPDVTWLSLDSMVAYDELAAGRGTCARRGRL